MINSQHKKDYNDFSEHPLAPLFFEYVDILRSRHFHKEADDLIAVAEKYYLPENKKIITKIVTKRQKVELSDGTKRFHQYLRELWDS
jgi:hypothetical protein